MVRVFITDAVKKHAEHRIPKEVAENRLMIPMCIILYKKPTVRQKPHLDVLTGYIVRALEDDWCDL